MKITFLKTSLVILVVATAGYVQAQSVIRDLDNVAIHPFGTTFSFNDKFIAAGESGGVIGPTQATGCDLYGFRAQYRPDAAINMGMQRDVNGRLIPTISTSTNLSLAFYQETTFVPTTAQSCGTLLALWGRSPSSNNVLNIFGSATAFGGSFGPSDRTLKRNIQPIENALEIVSQLKGYTYEYRTDERPELNLPKGQRYGFITQEVQAVMPSIVRQADGIDDKPADFQVMEYDAIMPVLAEAINLQQDEIQTQKDVITKLEEQNSLLEARLERLEALILGDKARSEQIDLPNASGVELGQNRPNPSDGTTAIEYTLPKDMTNATLVVYDLNGREISSQTINDQNGVIELNTRSWASGAYIYSVVVDGRVLARKKMMVQ